MKDVNFSRIYFFLKELVNYLYFFAMKVDWKNVLAPKDFRFLDRVVNYCDGRCNPSVWGAGPHAT